MGFPKITIPRFLLMSLIFIGGPSVILLLSREMTWLAVPLSLLLVLLGRYASTSELRRLSTTILLAITVGTICAAVLLDSARKDVMTGPWQLWHIPLVLGVLISSYAIGYLTIWSAYKLLAAFSIDFLGGLDEYVQKETKEVRKFLINQYLGFSQAYQIVEDGKVSISKPQGLLGGLGGRGLLIITPANAVATEWGGDIRRVFGPGIFWTERFELVKHVVPLNPQRLEFDIPVQTCEGIELSVKGFAYYQVKRPNYSEHEASKPDFEQRAGPGVKEKNGKRANPPDEDSARAIARALSLPQPRSTPINREAVLRVCESIGGQFGCQRVSG